MFYLVISPGMEEAGLGQRPRRLRPVRGPAREAAEALVEARVLRVARAAAHHAQVAPRAALAQHTLVVGCTGPGHNIYLLIYSTVEDGLKNET